MSCKDSIAIAAAVSAVGRHEAIDRNYAEGWHAANSAVAHRLAAVLAADNPRFDRARFLRACAETS